LLFSAARDPKPCLWRSDSGVRIGTFDGHEGAVYGLDVDSSSSRLLTGAADNSIRTWSVASGNVLQTVEVQAIIKHVQYNHGATQYLAVYDEKMGVSATVAIFDAYSEDTPYDGPKVEAKVSIVGHNGIVNKAFWSPLNDRLVTSTDKGKLAIWDVERQTKLQEIDAHKGSCSAMDISKDFSVIATGSQDGSVKLWDFRSLKQLNALENGRPVNAIALSPTQNHLFVGGGQEASKVTLEGKKGNFEVKIFHTVFSEELGSVEGHFGPINSLAVHPDGLGFTSGGEDGYIKSYMFDKSYFTDSLAIDELNV